MSRFETLCWSTTGQLKLMREIETGQVKICDDRGWFSGHNIEGAEPNLLRETFPDIEDHVVLEHTNHCL